MDNFKFECKIDYKYIIDFLNSNIDKIWDFFNLDKETISIKITDNYDEFKNIFTNMLDYAPSHYTCGFIIDSKKTVVVLNYEDYIKSHKESKEAYLKMILHECVHVVHSIYCNRNYPIKCIWEGIATYLSNQYDNHSISEIKEENLLNDKLSYVYYYNIMRLLIETYDYNEILKILKNDIEPDNYIYNVYKNNK